MTTPSEHDLTLMTEAAARAYRPVAMPEGDVTPWESLRPGVQEGWRNEVRPVVGAVMSVLPELGWVHPRTIEKLGELDDLGSGALVRTPLGYFYERVGDLWYGVGVTGGVDSSRINLPVVVLFEPEPRP